MIFCRLCQKLAFEQWSCPPPQKDCQAKRLGNLKVKKQKRRSCWLMIADLSSQWNEPSKEVFSFFHPANHPMRVFSRRQDKCQRKVAKPLFFFFFFTPSQAAWRWKIESFEIERETGISMKFRFCGHFSKVLPPFLRTSYWLSPSVGASGGASVAGAVLADFLGRQMQSIAKSFDKTDKKFLKNHKNILTNCSAMIIIRIQQ